MGLNFCDKDDAGLHGGFPNKGNCEHKRF